MSVKMNLKNILSKEKVLAGGMPRILLAAAGMVRAHLLQNWGEGKGGTETAMKALTRPYAKAKSEGKIPGHTKGGRRPIRDLNLSGELYKGLTTKSDGPTRALVYFSGTRNVNVARGNYDAEPKMMELSDRFKDKIRDAVAGALSKAASGGAPT
jgi:hypothetical protein